MKKCLFKKVWKNKARFVFGVIKQSAGLGWGGGLQVWLRFIWRAVFVIADTENIAIVKQFYQLPRNVIPEYSVNVGYIFTTATLKTLFYQKAPFVLGKTN